MAPQTNGRLGWRGALAGALALGALIPVGCVFIHQVLRNDIPFVVLGAPGFLVGWIVISILYQDEYGGKNPDVAFLLVYLMVNTALWAALWAAVIMSLRKSRGS